MHQRHGVQLRQRSQRAGEPGVGVLSVVVSRRERHAEQRVGATLDDEPILRMLEAGPGAGPLLLEGAGRTAETGDLGAHLRRIMVRAEVPTQLRLCGAVSMGLVLRREEAPTYRRTGAVAEGPQSAAVAAAAETAALHPEVRGAEAITTHADAVTGA